jgi:hypothetical protein
MLCVQVVTAEDREKQVKRYLLQAARVTQEQQNQELRMGTEKGLQALTRELFLASEVCMGQHGLSASCIAIVGLIVLLFPLSLPRKFYHSLDTHQGLLLPTCQVRSMQTIFYVEFLSDVGLDINASTCSLCFVMFQYEEQVPPGMVNPPNAPVRGGWEACRFYLLQASQLAIQREQLQAIVTTHEEALSRHSYSGSEMRKAERGGSR